MSLVKENDDKLIKIINNRLEKMNDVVYCNECGKINDKENKYCIHCGHKLQKISKKDKSYKEFCVYCGEKLDKEDNFCCNCGHEVQDTILEKKICVICGEWCDGSEHYCWNCGHDIYDKNYLPKLISDKKCPNCKTYYNRYSNYCDCCGTKLINK